MDKSFSDWATIVGGYSGLLSFFYVLYERMTSGPKVTVLLSRRLREYIFPKEFPEVGVTIYLSHSTKIY